MGFGIGYGSGAGGYGGTSGGYGGAGIGGLGCGGSAVLFPNATMMPPTIIAPAIRMLAVNSKCFSTQLKSFSSLPMFSLM